MAKGFYGGGSMIYLSLTSSLLTTFISGAATLTGDVGFGIFMGILSAINLIPILRVLAERRENTK